MSCPAVAPFRCARFLLGCLLAWVAPLHAQTLGLRDEVRTAASLTDTVVTLSGRSELRLTGTGDVLPGCVVNLDSPDALLLFTGVVPSSVVSTYLGRIRVEGAAAVSGTNVRVTSYAHGAAVQAHAPDFQPLEVFDGRHFTGNSRKLSLYTGYNNTLLGGMAGAIRSFKLKRGYMATLATLESGAGQSRNYVAQDGDLEVSILPAGMDNAAHFVRVFPWRWVSKKGIGGNIAAPVKAHWWYNWNLDQNSPLDREYVAIRHTRWWPDLNQNWKTRGVNHLLGFNEPDSADQANMTVADSLGAWPDLLATGLRVGSPAPTDGGLTWLYDFVDQADAANLRVDYVALHYYRSYSSASDPAGATTQLYNFLKGVHDRVKRPLWITEFNNGANWTSGPDPTYAQQQATLAAMIEMLDNTPWVERYALYNWVEDVRRAVWDDGSLTAAGVTYRDKVSPLAYLQEMPDSGIGTSTRYSFDGHTHDLSGNGLDAMRVGAPRFVTGRFGQALEFDGAADYVQITPRTGDNTDFTFAGWVNWGGGADWQRVFDLGSDTEHHLFLTPKAGGLLRFTINGGNGDQTVTGPALTPGEWTHVALTLSGNTGKLFVNGALVGTNTAMTANPADAATTYNYLGRSRFAADPLFKGRLDDLRFLSSALTDAQIATLATATPPLFTVQNLWKPEATPGLAYASSLAADVVGGTAPLTFAKMDGPTWLTVSAAGVLGGTPTAADAGPANALVRVTDANGSMHTAMINLLVTPLTGLIVAGTDDAEESSAKVMNLDSTDLELVNDGALGNQLIGLRFAGLALPQGAVVTGAYLQFTADEAQSEATNLAISVEAADDSTAIGTGIGDLSSRAETPFRVAWAPPAWNTLGEAGPAQRTPNLAGLVQQVVSRPGWSSGQALTFLVRGTGHRTAESFDKAGGNPPQLILTFASPPPLVTVTSGISLGANDAEQSAAGVVNLDSTDLELVNDGTLGNQTVGLRFEGVAVPRGAVIVSSSIQLTTDEAQSEATNLTLTAQAADHAPAFTTTASSLGAAARPRVSSSVSWAPSAWATLGEAGSDQRTPDISALVREVTSRSGWTPGNAMAFFVTGAGHRTAESADKTGGYAPVLSVTYRAQYPAGSFENWATARGNPGTPTADPDGDGRPNLLEYALGLDPTRPDTSKLPLTQQGSQLVLQFTIPVAAAEVTCAAEWSDRVSGGVWSTAGVTTLLVSDDGVNRVYQASLPAGSGQQRFVRLRASR